MLNDTIEVAMRLVTTIAAKTKAFFVIIIRFILLASWLR
jgi:hypothetical protein